MSLLKTRSYFCGGTGANIGAQFGVTNPGVCFLDSSDANLAQLNIPEDQIYRIPNTDGAGGNQGYMMPYARKHADDMLAAFEPGEFNIVVCSIDGGTGPTIAWNLMGKLLGAGYTAVLVVIGGFDNTRRNTNASNTIKNLEIVSAKAKKPVVMAWIPNDAGEQTADQEALFVLDALVALTDQENGRLDTMDVANWVNYNNLCSVDPQLCSLTVLGTRQEAVQVLEPISIASLYVDPIKNTPFGTPFVHTNGIVTNPAKLQTEQLHFVINTRGIQTLAEDIDKERARLNTAQSGYNRRRAVVSVDDNTTDDGFVAN
jgi:hypothetical protein